MAKPKFISRRKLLVYAGLLGRDSMAACALRYYDSLKFSGHKNVKIEMRNSGFSIHTGSGGVAKYG